MNNTFKVVLIVPSQLIGTLVQVIESEGILESITPHSETVTRQPKKKKHNGLYPSSEKVLECMHEGHVIHVTKLASRLGMPKGTVSSCLHYLKKDGHVENVGRGLWKTKGAQQ